MKQSNQIEMSLILKDFEKGNEVSAYNNIIKYLINYPNDESALYNSAYMAEKIGYINEAIIKYKKIIKKNSNHWRSINNLYLIYFHQQKYSESLVLVNAVLEIKPNYQPVLRDKAHILYHLQKLDTALEIIIESLKLNPNDYIALNVMGMIYSGMGSEETAIKIYNQAILIKKNYYPTYNNLAKCLNILKRVDEAEKNLKYCLNLKPDFDEAINNLGNVYTVSGKYKKAIPLYKKILKKNKDHQHANLNIAISYFFLGDEIKAEKHFLIAKKINPNDDRFQKNYSLFLLFQQNYKQAWKIADGRLKLNDFILTGTYIDNIKDKIWTDNSLINSSEKILIIKEQGVGDEILHSTIYPDLIKKFPNCKIETEDRLLSIFKRSYETNNQIIKDKSISGDKYKIKNIDKIIFAQSLGRLFRNSINDFPKKNNIVAKQDLVKKISSKLNNISNNKKIGIAWKSKRFFFW